MSATVRRLSRIQYSLMGVEFAWEPVRPAKGARYRLFFSRDELSQCRIDKLIGPPSS